MSGITTRVRASASERSAACSSGDRTARHGAMVYPKFIKKAKGTTTIGLTLHANSAHYANSLGSCGWDWLVVDLPNSLSDFRDVFNQLTGMGDTGTTAPLIRVGGPNDRSGIQQATDQGAAGVLVPNVRSAAEARKARGVTLYPNAYKTDVRGVRMPGLEPWTYTAHSAAHKSCFRTRVWTDPIIHRADARAQSFWNADVSLRSR